MKICPKCGAENNDAYVFCSVCRTYLNANESVDYRNVVYYPNKGLIAWSIFTMLLARVPGLIALITAANINNCSSVYVQDRRIKAAKIWNIVGTVLGIVSIILIILFGDKIG